MVTWAVVCSGACMLCVCVCGGSAGGSVPYCVYVYVLFIMVYDICMNVCRP